MKSAVGTRKSVGVIDENSILAASPANLTPAQVDYLVTCHQNRKAKPSTTAVSPTKNSEMRRLAAVHDSINY